jgi:DNA-binding beta-propeller fold protein YncE
MKRLGLSLTRAAEFATFLVAVNLLAAPLPAAQLYWIDAQGIHRSELDATNQQLVAGSTTGIRSMAADPVSGKLYWTTSDLSQGLIRVANLDGSGVTNLLTGVERPAGIAVDHTRGHLYYGSAVSQIEKVFRSGLDGSNPQPWIDIQDNEELFVDEGAAKLYKLDRDDDLLTRMNLDGTAVESIGDDVDGLAHSMAVDLASGKVYWTYSLGVYRSNLDGSDAQKIWTIPVNGDYVGLAVDSANNRLYLANMFANTIYRANLDGSDFAPLITGVPTVSELHIVQPIPEPATFAMFALGGFGLAVLARRQAR